MQSTAFRRLHRVLNLTRARHNAQCVLAGGCVRDVLMNREPKDWDVFYLGSDVAAIRAAFQSPPTEGHFRRNDQLAAEIDSPFGLIQILATPLTTVDQVLDATDFNVSAFAFDGSLHALADIDDIAPGKPLKLLHVGNPIHELARGFDFAQRFEMVFRLNDIIALCEAVASGKFIRRKQKTRTIVASSNDPTFKRIRRR